MSTASSISQFMAVLSGGVNPSLLRTNSADNVMTNGQKASSFQSLIGSGFATKIAVPANSGQAAPQLTQSDIEKLASLSDGEFSSAAVWQFIRQQASVDSENAIVLNLSEKGIPQDVIDELQQLFGTNDLITVLRDPKLSTQLDNALKNTTTETIDTPQLAGVINAILNQNKGDIANTITFKVDEGAPVHEFLDKLIRDGYIDSYADAGFRLVPIENQVLKQPVNLTFVQQQIARANPAPQEATPVGQSGTPFALKGRNIMDRPDGSSNISSDDAVGLERALQQTTANSKGEAPQSIADRLANIVNPAQGQNVGQSNAAAFSALMSGANPDTMTSVDGDYIVPFEAGFKTASQAANPLTAQQSAAQSHPTTQMVALSMTKMAGKTANGEGSQSYRLKLDPPEMGRIDIEMDVIEKTGQLKALIKAEKPEALGLLQRDMHVLLKAMQDAGFENMTQQDLSFSLSQDSGNMADNNRNSQSENFGQKQGQAANDMADADMIAVKGEMTIIVDPVTGQRHVNMIV